MSYTPGPWKLIASNLKQWIVTGKDGAYDIAIVRNICEQEDNHANANLIAAAPDMYEALQELDNAAKQSASIIGFASQSLKFLKMARAALAKARGQA